MNINIDQKIGHHKELIMTITSGAYYIWGVIFTYFHIMISIFEVCLRESSVTLKLVKEFIKSRNVILILYGDLFQLAVINTHPKGTIFLPHK